MKIKDFSEEKRLSRQAVYKAINKAGFSARSLTDRNGNITKKGFSVLNRLFPPDPSPVPPDPDPDEPEQAEQVNPDQQRISELLNRIDELERKCREWESRYFEQVNQTKAETEQFRILLAKEQELRMLAENKGFFRRLFSGKGKTN